MYINMYIYYVHMYINMYTIIYVYNNIGTYMYILLCIYNIHLYVLIIHVICNQKVKLYGKKQASQKNLHGMFQHPNHRGCQKEKTKSKKLKTYLKK